MFRQLIIVVNMAAVLYYLMENVYDSRSFAFEFLLLVVIKNNSNNNSTAAARPNVSCTALAT